MKRLKSIFGARASWTLGETLVLGGLTWLSGYLIGLGSDGPMGGFLKDQVKTRDAYIDQLKRERERQERKIEALQKKMLEK